MAPENANFRSKFIFIRESKMTGRAAIFFYSLCFFPSLLLLNFPQFSFFYFSLASGKFEERAHKICKLAGQTHEAVMKNSTRNVKGSAEK